jgi:hypothetical protein
LAILFSGSFAIVAGFLLLKPRSLSSDLPLLLLIICFSLFLAASWFLIFLNKRVLLYEDRIVGVNMLGRHDKTIYLSEATVSGLVTGRVGTTQFRIQGRNQALDISSGMTHWRDLEAELNKRLVHQNV